MKFTTKWKTGGHRYTGTLSIQMKPCDKDNNSKSSAHQENKGIGAAKENVENSSEGKASLNNESLMVIGQFDCGVNRGVRSWSFKGYRK
jgi:hypothetical protein